MELSRADGTKVFRFLNSCNNVDSRANADEMTKSKAKSLLKNLEDVAISISGARTVLKKIAEDRYSLSGTYKRKPSSRKRTARKTIRVNIMKLAGRGGGIHVIANGSERDYSNRFTLEDLLEYYKPEFHSAIKREWNKTKWVND